VADRLAHVDGQADGAALVGDGAGDRLADPPGGVGREFVALGVVEFLDRAHQADIALLDQIHHGQAVGGVFFGDRDHQAQVGLDQVLAGGAAGVDLAAQHLALGVAEPALIVQQRIAGGVGQLHLLGQINFLAGRQQRHLADLLEVHAHRVIERDIRQIG
jgi:hypothetical protein